MRPDQVKEFYLLELDNKHKLDSRMPGYVALMSVIGGLLYFAIHEFTLVAPWLTRVFCVLIGSSGVLYLAALFLFCRATFHPRYAKMPTPSKMDAYLSELHDYASRTGDPLDPEAEVSATQDENMAVAIDRNEGINLSRSARYYDATRLWAISAILALMASSTVLVIGKLQEVGATQQEGTVTNEEKPKEPSSPTTSGQPTAPAQPGPAPEKPVAPKNTLFKGERPLNTGGKQPK